MLFLTFLPHELFLPTQIGSLGLQSLSTYVRTIGWFINVAWKARTHKSKKVEFPDPGVAHSNREVILCVYPSFLPCNGYKKSTGF